MSSLTLQQLELRFYFHLILTGYEDILDDLFCMRLALESGDMPYFPPPSPFDPMETIIPDAASELYFAPPTPSISTSECEMVGEPSPPFQFDPMKTVGKYS